MAERVVWIDLVNGLPRTGIWCDECLTSAAVEIDMYWLRASGLQKLGTFAHCLRCDTDTDDE